MSDLDEIQSELAGIHRLAQAAEFGDVPKDEALTEISGRLSRLYHGALSRVLAARDKLDAFEMERGKAELARRERDAFDTLPDDYEAPH